MAAKRRKKARTSAAAENGRERALWKGSIAFGLVHIPVSLHSAELPERLDFDLVDRRDHAPIGYRKVNKETGDEVAAKDIIRAIKTDDGQYVTLTDEEIRAAHTESSHTIEVVQFVTRDEVPPQYFSRPYYVRPAKSFTKAYVLLRDVLARSARVGIATIVLRTRQHIAALLPQDQLMMLVLLRYAHDIRKAKTHADDGKSKATAAELKLAEKLVEGMSGKWEPTKFKDPTRERILALVAEKAETGVIRPRAAKGAPKAARIINLMEMLEASIADKKTAGGSRAPRRRARRKTG